MLMCLVQLLINQYNNNKSIHFFEDERNLDISVQSPQSTHEKAVTEGYTLSIVSYKVSFSNHSQRTWLHLTILNSLKIV